MIRVSYQHNQDVDTLQVKDHAGYAEAGYDLVCAAVSSIVFGGANALEEVEENSTEKKDNYFYLSSRSERGKIIMHTVLVQLQTVKAIYPQYIKIDER